MKVAGIIRDSIVDGEGLRDVVFLQGCCHHCPGCHNPQTWDASGGRKMTPWYVADELSGSTNDVTISGGEPLLQLTELYDLLSILHCYQCKNIWLYTGFTFEQIAIEEWKQLSRYIDVVVDGRFELDKRDKSLLFRGSSNQRLIDLKKSVEGNGIVEYLPKI